MLKIPLLTTMLAALLISQVSFADTAPKNAGNKQDYDAYFQIDSVKKNGKNLSLGGYWIIADKIRVNPSTKSKPKPKIPPLRKFAYILPPCKSELENYMDEAFGGGREDWCARLKGSLSNMDIPTIEHDDFY